MIDPNPFLLNPIFAKDFPGSGGTRHISGIKIQLEYDLCRGDKHFSATHPFHPCFLEIYVFVI